MVSGLHYTLKKKGSNVCLNDGVRNKQQAFMNTHCMPLFFFLPCYKAYGLVPQPGIEPVAPAVKLHALSLGLQGSPCMSLITMGARRCHVFDECPL